MTLSRRRYLAALGGVTGVALAGCAGGGAAERTPYDAESVSAPGEVSDYVSDSSNFDGTMVDLTDRDEVEVMVGAQGNGGHRAFGPPAIQISTGTTVVWEWSGRGSAHNVQSAGSGPLQSSLTSEGGHTYEYTFDERGTFRYVCTPHQMQGMKGAVVVE